MFDEVKSLTTDSGLNDARGMIFPEVLEGRIFHGFDFTRAIFENSWIENCTFENCLFERSNLKGVSEHRNHFNKCRFVKVNFSGASIGNRTSVYNDCLFHSCSFKNALFQNAVFKNSNFIEIKLTGLDFNASGFWNCRFEGVLDDVWIKGKYAVSLGTGGSMPTETGMHEVDFSRSKLSWITTSLGCAIEKVKLPIDCKIVKCSDLLNRYEDVAKSYFNDIDFEAVEDFLEIYTPHMSGQEKFIISLKEIEDRYKQDIACKLFELLAKFEVNGDAHKSIR